MEFDIPGIIGMGGAHPALTSAQLCVLYLLATSMIILDLSFTLILVKD